MRWIITVLAGPVPFAALAWADLKQSLAGQLAPNQAVVLPLGTNLVVATAAASSSSVVAAASPWLSLPPSFPSSFRAPFLSSRRECPVLSSPST